jgi:putative SOS response-associated peptidase YedK
MTSAATAPAVILTFSLCNLYSSTMSQAAIRDLFKVARHTAGNLPPLSAIFPDWQAPIVRVNECERELTMMRWGMHYPLHRMAPDDCCTWCR